MTRPVLVTGAAGFIGAAPSACACWNAVNGSSVSTTSRATTTPSSNVARLARIESAAPADTWRFEPQALEDGEDLMALFAAEQPRVVVNLAAQVGVRYSLENPAAYIQSNLVGFAHIL